MIQPLVNSDLYFVDAAWFFSSNGLMYPARNSRSGSGRTLRYVAGSNLTAISAWTCRAVSAGAVHDVDSAARLLIEHCTPRREDANKMM